MAAVINGEGHPSTDFSASSPAKRKRDATPDEQKNLEGSNKPQPRESVKEESFQSSLKDLFQILSKYDSDLGIFRCPLPLRSNSAPENKRQKLSDTTSASRTIETRIRSDEYKTLRQFVEDVETAENSILRPSSPQPSPVSDIVERTKIFKRHLNNLIRRHPFKMIASGEADSQSGTPEEESNGLGAVARDDSSVLTVFGNAPRGRQLFSSLPRSGRRAHASGTEASVVNEADLPNGVATSNVVPFNTSNFEESRTSTRTLGEVFTSRASLPSLEPPRKHDSSTKHSSTVTWLSPVESATTATNLTGDKRYFSSSTVPMVPWIDYGYQQPIRSSRKRQQTGSGIDSEKQNTSPDAPKDGDTLFASMYSSFAPSLDSGGSVVASRNKGQFWWGKAGTRHLRTLLCGSERGPDVTSEIPETTLDEGALKHAVETFDPEVAEPTKVDGEVTEPDENEKEMDDILQDISELLRTLESYRQLRHLDPAASGAGGSERATDAESRTLPSDPEFEIYNTLKSNLSAMIATLPPYALAKLDGEQLAELNVSKKILLDGVDYPGTMEEDDYSLHQKQLPKVPQGTGAARPSTVNVGRTPPTAPYQRHPARTRQPSSSSQPHQQAYATRTPSAPYQPNSSSQHPTPLQPSSQRPNYPQQQFPQQSPTPQYTRAAMLQQFQRPTQNGNSPNIAQRTPSSAQAPPSQPYQRPAPANYQHRASDGTFQSPVPAPRSASPQKPGTTPQRQYVSPAPAHSQSRQFQQQQPHYQQQAAQAAPSPNFPANQTGTVAPPYSSSPSAMAYSRGAAGQATAMEHNKPQSTESQRQNSSTPRPSYQPYANGQSYQAHSTQENNSSG